MIHPQPDSRQPDSSSSTPATRSSDKTNIINNSTATSGTTTLRARSKSTDNTGNDSQPTSNSSSPRPTPLEFGHAGFSSFTLSQPAGSSHSQSHSRPSPHSRSPPRSRSPVKPHARSQSASSNFLTMLVSPRSSNYERLEGGHGPSRVHKRKFTWQKFAIAAVVVIGLVWLFGPRRSDLKHKVGWGDSAPPYEDDIDGDVYEPPATRPYTAPPKHNTITPPQANTPGNAEKPLTFDTDPDRSATPHCKKPHSSKSTLVQWSLMIDAGSTGSRIHIYKFNNCGASPAYEYEVFVKNQKGLSSFKGRAVEAAMSLDELMDEATKVVPKEMWGCTPVYVKATAGLRMLGVREADEILKAVEKRLRDEYPFSVPVKDAVVVMDGKDEGVYAWITANYLLGTIGGKGGKGKETYAVLDLGGASTQIVFKPEFGDTKSDKGLEEGEHKYDLKFGGEDYVLYQHSYLGYGLMQARRHTHALVEFMDSIRPGGVANKKDGGGREKRRVPNPCLAKGTEREVEYFDEERRKDGTVVMYGGDVGGFEACQRVISLVLAKDAICETKPCSFNGVYQPSLLDTFKHGKVLLLSYFYDRLEPLLPISPTSSTSTQPTLDNLPISTLTTLASSLCAGKEGWKAKGWTSNPKLLAELEDRPEWCLDMTFMHALLRLGYEFGDARDVRVGKQVDGTELGWCLGAAISALDGDVRCRV